MNGYSERLEAFVRIKMPDGHAAQISDYRIMLRKTYVNHIPFIPHCLLYKRFCKDTKFVHIVHLPDHVVAKTYGINHIVKSRISAEYSVKRCHKYSLAPFHGRCQEIKPTAVICCFHRNVNVISCEIECPAQ